MSFLTKVITPQAFLFLMDQMELFCLIMAVIKISIGLLIALVDKKNLILLFLLIGILTMFWEIKK